MKCYNCDKAEAIEGEDFCAPCLKEFQNPFERMDSGTGSDKPTKEYL